MIKEFPTLFKKSKTNKINIWKINVIKNKEQFFLQTIRGVENGKLVTTVREIKKGKGKKNKTEQAIFEATSKWNNKINKDGYVTDKKEAEHKIVIKPILINNKFKARKILPISLSYDHRVIDGADAVRFTKLFADLVSKPNLLINGK